MVKKSIGALGLIVIAILILLYFYIKNETQSNSSILINSNTMETAENEEYIFYIDKTSSESSLLYKNKKTGDIGNIVKNPHNENYDINNMFFVKGKFIYYTYQIRDYSERGLYDTHGKFRMVEVDTTNFNEKIIFEVNANIGDNLFGIKNSNHDRFDFYSFITGFFLDETYLYFTTSENIWSIHRISGERNRIIENKMLRDYAYDGINIFYINDYMQIIKYNTKTNESEELSDILTDYFMLTLNKLFFLNRRDNNKVYSYDLVHGKIDKLNDREVLWFACNDEYIFYKEKYSDYLYRMDVNGQSNMVIYNDNISSIYLFRNYDNLFLFTQDNNLITVNKNSLDIIDMENE